MNLSVIIAYRENDIRRRQLEFQLKRLKGIEVIVSQDAGQDEWQGFNKSQLLNQGVLKSTKDNLLIMDVDIVVPIKALEKAIGAIDQHSIIFPYDKVDFVNERETEKVYLGKEHKTTMLRDKKDLATQGNYLITKENYIAIKGHDERYEGWGGEDGSFISSAITLIDKPYLRMKGTALHLYHPKSKEIRVIQGDKRELYTRYLKARYNKQEMLTIINEHNGTF